MTARLAAAVDACRAGGPDAEVYRAIVEHDAWLVPATRDGERLAAHLVERDDGARFLEVFSSAGARARAAAVEGAELANGPWVELRGDVLFGSLPLDGADRVNLDLHSEHATHFYRDQLPVLAAWARVAAVERALAHPDQFADALDVVAGFDAYYEVWARDGSVSGGGPAGRVLAPDSAGRRLAAVFTAEDRATAFARALAEAARGADWGSVDDAPRPVDVELRAADGGVVFARLAADGVDGVVFNPRAGCAPVALAGRVLGVLASRAKSATRAAALWPGPSS
ncbi:MAG: hypothetical protein H6699_03000 [Myxococcales bacterium]|nr:hypothetical protein [Myxococcales bacterium]